MSAHLAGVPFLVPRQHFFGVRCPCGCYMVLEQIHGDPARAHCDRLRQPAYVVCDSCGEERRYTQADLITFEWPPAAPEPLF